MLSSKKFAVLTCACITSLSLAACSSESIESFTDEVITELDNIASGENTEDSNAKNELPVVQADENILQSNVDMDMADNTENRTIAATVVQDFYNDIARFHVDKEDDLILVGERLGEYASWQAETSIGTDFINSERDVEASLLNLSDEELAAVSAKLSPYIPHNNATNFEELNDVQKVTSLIYLGDNKTAFNYNYRLNELSEPTEYTVDETQLIFRENDILVPSGAISHNHNDNIEIENYLPLRIIDDNGVYKVDVFNVALLSNSPAVLEAAFSHASDDAENKTIEVIDKVLSKSW